MEDSLKLKNHILRKVKDFYSAVHKPAEFIPYKSAVNYAGRVYDEKEISNLVDSALEFWLTAGRYAFEFEKKLAAFLGVRFCLAVNSGSSANLLAITALMSFLLKGRRIKPKDEVITSACGFPTTLNPILQNNLVPVFVDVEPGTYVPDIRAVEKAVTRKTKAIFLAHTLGNPNDLGGLKKLAKKRDLWLIEDNCDSLGSLYKGRRTGSFGDISTCSFYPAHHITTGEGGAVLTDDPLLKKIILSLRDWGRDCWCQPGTDNTCKRRFEQKFGDLPFGYDHKYVYSHIGYNLKVTDMQAAIGVAQLAKLPQFIKARQRNFQYLLQRLRRYERYFILPEATRYSKPSWFGFPLLVKESAPFDRRQIVTYLEDNKIATRMLFGGNLTKQPAYKHARFRISVSLRNTDRIMEGLFWIGVYPGITEEKMKYVADIFDRFIKERRRQ
ncbi:MAG: lipopolysaccharide biosynthesis protein RfbH [Candidatus Omnitrophica bacterium]|nr:lipopolysaccharide biosynthesis protein RfbH [Candidatus Omnitrophota bacterium]